MGASDFVDGAALHLRRPAGRADRLRACGTSRSPTTRPQILPLLRQALRSTRDLKVIGDAVEPAGVDEDQRLADRRPADRRPARSTPAYARYFVKFVQAYQRGRRAGLRASPCRTSRRTASPRGYPGMDLPVAQEAQADQALGPALRARRPATRRSSATTTTGPSTPTTSPPPRPGEDPETEYPPTCCAPAPALARRHGVPLLRRRPEPPDRAARRVPGQGHLVHRVLRLARRRPTRRPRSSRDTLKWHARNLVIGVTRNWAQTVVNWNLALDPSGGPHNGGCDTCTGVVTVGPGEQVTRNAEYYTLGHLARFVQPGATRIASTSFGTTGWNGQIMDVAFRNPDGSTALVVHNENDDPRTFAVAAGRRVVRLHAARRRAGHVHLAGLDGARRRPAAAPLPTAMPATADPNGADAGRTRSTTTPRRAGRPAPASSRASGSRSTSGATHRRTPRRARHRRRTAGDFPRG